jgi:hypothetical protein
MLYILNLAQCLTPVILATQEAVRNITILSQPRQKVQESPSPPIKAELEGTHLPSQLCGKYK